MRFNMQTVVAVEEKLADLKAKITRLRAKVSWYARAATEIVKEKKKILTGEGAYDWDWEAPLGGILRGIEGTIEVHVRGVKVEEFSFFEKEGQAFL